MCACDTCVPLCAFVSICNVTCWGVVWLAWCDVMRPCMYLCNMCTYVGMHTYVCMLRACMLAYVRACMYVCNMCVDICMYANQLCTHAGKSCMQYMYACSCIYAYDICMLVCLDASMYVSNAFVHVCIHIYIYIYICAMHVCVESVHACLHVCM